MANQPNHCAQTEERGERNPRKNFRKIKEGVFKTLKNDGGNPEKQVNANTAAVRGIKGGGGAANPPNPVRPTLLGGVRDPPTLFTQPCWGVPATPNTVGGCLVNPPNTAR